MFLTLQSKMTGVHIAVQIRRAVWCSAMISVEEYRSRIGRYSHRAHRSAWKPDTLVVRKETLSLSVRLILFALLVACGSVEAIPGPTFTKERDELLIDLSKRVECLEATVLKLQTAYDQANEKKNQWKNACIQVEERCERLEAQSRRDNLIFHNMPHKEGYEAETWTESEQKVRQHLKSMDIDEENIIIDRAHRLNSKKKDSPIIVKFAHFKDRENILSRAHSLKKQKKKETRKKSEEEEEKEVFVGEDYTIRVRKVRGFLRPFMQEAYDNGKKVRMSYDKLIIENSVFYYDEKEKKLTKQKPDVMSCLQCVINE